MSKYNFSLGYMAKHAVLGTAVAIYIPDEVACNQRDFDEKRFPVIFIMGGLKVKGRARLKGKYYGLNTCGTGDPIVVWA